jgi:hypothetical protein
MAHLPKIGNPEGCFLGGTGQDEGSYSNLSLEVNAEFERKIAEFEVAEVTES